MRRFSIAGLMILTLVVGLTVAALRDASETWAGILQGVTLFLLASSLLGVLHRRDARRAGWQGFALFGWGYLALAMGPSAEPSKLGTAQLLDALYARINPAISQGTPFRITFLADGTGPLPKLSRPAAGAGPSPGPAAAPAASPTLFTWVSVSGNRDQFRRVGHCLFTLLLALIGMGVGRWFHRTA